MKPPTYQIDRPIYLLGDHHGFTGEIFDAIEKQNVRNAVILHVGDGEEGISFGPTQFLELDRWLSRRQILFLGMRGNHCDPNLFDGRIDLPHYKLVPDYTRLTVNGKSWLLIGGAISIDRLDRINGFNWWPQETFELRHELAGPADVLVSHSGPRWIGPSSSNHIVDLYARREDESTGSDLITELETERMLHEELFHLVRPKHWYLGHFHTSEVVRHQDCEIRILNINELHLHTG